MIGPVVVVLVEVEVVVVLVDVEVEVEVVVVLVDVEVEVEVVVIGICEYGKPLSAAPDPDFETRSLTKQFDCERIEDPQPQPLAVMVLKLILIRKINHIRTNVRELRYFHILS